MKAPRGIFKRAHSRDFWIDYRDGAGKRHRERIGSRADALEALHNRQREVADGRFTAPRARARARSLTFRELALESLEHKRLRIRPRSYDTDRRRLDAILRRIGAIPAAEITPQLLANLFLDLGKNGAVPGRSNGGLTGSTLNRYRSLISSIFTWAIQVGRLEVHPLGAVKRYPENPSRVRYLFEDEEKKLRDVIRLNCPAREAEFDLALYTGMRKGEQLTLKWADVDLANGTARVRGKSGVRPVHLNESAKRALAQLERQAGARRTFVSPDTESADQTEWPRWFHGCIQKAGIDNFHFHDLRHTFASRLAMAGTDLLSLARLLGHSKVTQTEKYAHLSPSHVRDAVERIGTLQTSAERPNPREARD